MARIVTLLTDFGQADTYVGQLKGAILEVEPGAVLVDLSHAVPPQDIQAGAFLLWTAVESFPAGSVHLAVVDPGVGTPRRAVAVQAGRGDLFVGPDNGLLVPAVERLGGVRSAVELTEPRFWRARPSKTFHGRDLFAPVAAHLAAGAPLSRLGRPVADLAHPFAIPAPRTERGRLVGVIVHVDAFGNLITNVPAEAVPRACRVLVAGRVVDGAPHPHYQAVPAGTLLALVGSAGLLEVSARDASAAQSTGARRGDPIEVERR